MNTTPYTSVTDGTFVVETASHAPLLNCNSTSTPSKNWKPHALLKYNMLRYSLLGMQNFPSKCQLPPLSLRQPGSNTMPQNHATPQLASNTLLEAIKSDMG